MKEIGGYFGLDELIDKPYHKNMIELNTGRNALLYIVKARNIKKIYLPYYLCNSVSNALEDSNYEFDYYHVDEYFMPVFNKKLNKDEYIYIVNYYGQLTNNCLMKLNDKYKRIIVDNTQAFFQEPLIGVDTLLSCRKYFGVPDGAYLSTNYLLNAELEVDTSNERMLHILGRFEGKASDYYNEFQENDKEFKNISLKYMSKLTKNILGAIDYENVMSKRNENYSFLESKLKEINKLKLIRPDGAFAYPLYIENGVEIRRKLAVKKIYIPTLWPNVIKDNMQGSIEYDYAANILPLPCDQRYSTEDMERLIKVVKECIN